MQTSIADENDAIRIAKLNARNFWNEIDISRKNKEQLKVKLASLPHMDQDLVERAYTKFKTGEIEFLDEQNHLVHVCNTVRDERDEEERNNRRVNHAP